MGLYLQTILCISGQAWFQALSIPVKSSFLTVEFLLRDIFLGVNSQNMLYLIWMPKVLKCAKQVSSLLLDWISTVPQHSYLW